MKDLKVLLHYFFGTEMSKEKPKTLELVKDVTEFKKRIKNGMFHRECGSMYIVSK